MSKSSISLDFHSKPGDGNFICEAIVKITYSLFFMIFYLMTVYKRFLEHNNNNNLLFLKGITVPVNISAFSTTALPLP